MAAAAAAATVVLLSERLFVLIKRESDEELTAKAGTHFGVAEMIFLWSSCAGHVVLPSSNFLSLDRKQRGAETTENQRKWLEK